MIDKAIVQDYASHVQAAANERLAKRYEKHENIEAPHILVSIEYGRRFARIVEEWDNGQRMVHAFVDMTNGMVVKAAGWKAPQKGKYGLAYRYDLTDPTSRALCYERCGQYGYLYEGANK